MKSDSRSPKARHRFGFSGQLTRSKKDGVTINDLLPSLIRQAELKQKLVERDRVALEEIAETEDLSRFQGFNPEFESPSIADKKTRLGRFVFVFMLLIGLTVVRSYISISKLLDLTSVNGFIQKSGVQAIFANLAQLVIIALAALVGALWILRKRRGSSSRLFST